jgi:magnesium transporter
MTTSAPSNSPESLKNNPELSAQITHDARLETIAERLAALEETHAMALLVPLDPSIAARALKLIPATRAAQLWTTASTELRTRISPHISPEYPKQWALNYTFPEGSLGRMMEPPQAVFAKAMTVRDAIANLKELIKREFITYIYIADSLNRLEGLVVMRDLLFAQPEQKLADIMMSKPFALRASGQLMDAMQQVLVKHFPVYPVVDDEGHLLGLVRGFRLFEAQAVEISAQAGSMVGVEKEERVSTPWLRSFRYRHPWLQLNLLTAFIAGAVVNFFQGTIDQIVVLAAFLPVLAGQSGNTGCQALAVTLRGMTLGELDRSRVSKVVAKEALLGVANGALVGLSAAVGMYLLASSQGNPNALTLSLIVLCAMVGSCCVSGLSGALVPLVLKKLGADPATASSIFLTTATDVASMGLLLSLATAVLL